MLPISLSRRCIALAVVMLTCSVSAFADEAGEVNRLLREGQHTEALNRANAWLADHPDDPRVRFLKGLVLSELRRTDEAISLFTKLAAEYPKRAELQNNLAVLYGTAGQYAKARAALDTAIGLKPDYAAAHENLGDIYVRLAIQSYEKALQLDASGAGARAKRSAIEQLLGAPLDAQPTVKNEAKVEPAYESRSEARTDAPVREQVAIVQAPRKAAPETAVPERDAVLKAVGDWAAAWSSRNVKAYLAWYASDFQTPNHVSRRTWERERRARIEGKKSIEVRVASPQVTLADGKATASFHQSYVSDAFKDESSKSLVFVKQKDGAWKIVQERAE